MATREVDGRKDGTRRIIIWHGSKQAFNVQTIGRDSASPSFSPPSSSSISILVLLIIGPVAIKLDRLAGVGVGAGGE